MVFAKNLLTFDRGLHIAWRLRRDQDDSKPISGALARLRTSGGTWCGPPLRIPPKPIYQNRKLDRACRPPQLSDADDGGMVEYEIERFLLGEGDSADRCDETIGAS